MGLSEFIEDIEKMLIDYKALDKAVLDIRRRPNFYREGGIWLDNHAGPAWRQISQDKWENQGFFGNISFMVNTLFKQSCSGIIGEIQSKAILVVTWLMWDKSDLGLNITMFERWPWGEMAEYMRQDRHYASIWWLHKYGTRWGGVVERAFKVLDSTHETEVEREPLSPTAKTLYDILQGIPKNQGLIGQELIAQYEQKTGKDLSSENFFRRYRKELIPWGLKNKPRIGYYLDQ